MEDRKYTQAEMDQALRAQQAFSKRRDDDDDDDSGSTWNWLLPLLAVGGIGYGLYKFWPQIKGAVSGHIEDLKERASQQIRAGRNMARGPIIEGAAALRGGKAIGKNLLAYITAGPVGGALIRRTAPDSFYHLSGKAGADKRLSEQAYDWVTEQTTSGRPVDKAKQEHIDRANREVIEGDIDREAAMAERTYWDDVKDLFSHKSIFNPKNW